MDSAENKWRPHRAMGAGVWCAVAWCALAGLAALPGLAGLQPARPWGALGAAAAFRLETTLQLNDAARASKEVGYKLRARLLLRPRWARDTSEYLLEFQVRMRRRRGVGCVCLWSCVPSFCLFAVALSEAVPQRQARECRLHAVRLGVGLCRGHYFLCALEPRID